MHNVDAAGRRFHYSYERVHIRAVHIDKAAGVVDDPAYFFYVTFEFSESIRIREHQRGDISVHLAFERFKVGKTFGVGWNGFHGVAANDCRSRIRAMRRIRYQHLLARISAFAKRGADHHHTRHFAVSPGRGLKRHRVQSGYLRQTFFKPYDYLERALSQIDGRQGMKVREAVDSRYLLIDSRIVFHCAGAQRIHSRIDSVVPGREPGEMPNHVYFGELGESLQVVCTQKAPVD